MPENSDQLKLSVTSAADTKGLENAQKKVDALGASASNAAKELDTLNAAQAKTKTASNEAGDALEKASKGAGEFAKDLGGVSRVASRIPGPVGKASGELRGLLNLLKTPGGVYTALLGAIAMGLAKIHAKIKEVFDDAEKQRVKNYGDALDGIKTKLEKLEKAYDKIKTARDNAFNANMAESNAVRSLEENRLEERRQAELFGLDTSSDKYQDINMRFDKEKAWMQNQYDLNDNKAAQRNIQQRIKDLKDFREGSDKIFQDFDDRVTALYNQNSADERELESLKHNPNLLNEYDMINRRKALRESIKNR